MTKKDWLSIGYVSLLVIIWGTLGSLVDFAFLDKEVYLAGSIGQISVFTATGILTSIIGIIVFPKIIKS